MSSTSVMSTYHACKFTDDADRYIQNLADDYGMSFVETVKRLIEAGIRETTIAQRILAALKDRYNLYNQNFIDNMNKHSELVHAALENGGDVSAGDDAWYSAESWHNKAQTVAEMIVLVETIIVGDC